MLILNIFPVSKQIGYDETAAAYIDEVLFVGFGEGGAGGLFYGRIGGAVQVVLNC